MGRRGHDFCSPLYTSCLKWGGLLLRSVVCVIQPMFMTFRPYTSVLSIFIMCRWIRAYFVLNNRAKRLLIILYPLYGACFVILSTVVYYFTFCSPFIFYQLKTLAETAVFRSWEYSVQNIYLILSRDLFSLSRLFDSFNLSVWETPSVLQIRSKPAVAFY